MSTAVYVRISQDREGRELGITRQREDCLALAQRHGWGDLEIFEDNDRGASTRSRKKRPEYARMLAAIRAGTVKRVVCYSTSRLTRRPMENEELIQLHEQHGVKFSYVMTGEADLSTASGRMVARFLAAADAREAEENSERVKRETVQRAEQGRAHGGRRCYGLQADGVDEEPTEADNVRRWFASILAGGTIMAIQRETDWHHSSVTAILRNPRYAGLRIVGGVEYRSPNSPIVAEATWRAVQAILDDPKRKTSNGRAKRWLGSGLFICSKCGIGVKVNYGNSSMARVYHCPKLIKGGCGRTWLADRIDDWVNDVITARLAEPDLADLLPVHADDTTGLDREAAGIRKRLEQLADAFADDDDADAADFKRASSRLRDRLADLETRLAQTGKDGALSVLAATTDPSAAYAGLDDVKRRAAIVDALATVRLVQDYRPGRSEWIPMEAIHIEWK